MKSIAFQRIVPCLALPLFIGAMLAGAAGEAKAGVGRVRYTVQGTNLCGQNVLGLRACCTARFDNGAFFAPTGSPPCDGAFCTGPYAAANWNRGYETGNFGIWSCEVFPHEVQDDVALPPCGGVALPVAPLGAGWFSVGWSAPAPPGATTFTSFSYFRFSTDRTANLLCGPFVFLGTKTTAVGNARQPAPDSRSGSQISLTLAPSLFNSATLPDGSTNTLNMVVTNLQFAFAPNGISKGTGTPDDPLVQSLFAASPDPIRAGPFTVAPGAEVAITNVHPSITDPANGSSVLARGSVRNSTGTAVPFLIEFLSDSPLPATTPWSLLVLSLVLATVGVLFARRVSKPKYA